MTDGFMGLDFANDIITLLKDKWIVGNVARPKMTTQWNIKAMGVGTRIYNEIIVSVDSENPQIFSLQQGDATDATKFIYDWLHDGAITLDVRTSESEIKVRKLVNETMRILKKNVVPTINNRVYIQILPEGITQLNEEYRNIYRYLISISALRINP